MAKNIALILAALSAGFIFCLWHNLEQSCVISSVFFSTQDVTAFGRRALENNFNSTKFKYLIFVPHHPPKVTKER